MNIKKIFSVIIFFLFSVCSSQCITGNCKVGNGTFKFENGSIYIGEWWNDEMNGKGTLYGLMDQFMLENSKMDYIMEKEHI